MVSPFCSLGSSLPQALIKSDLSERPVGYSSVISHLVKVTENTPEPYPRWASELPVSSDRTLSQPGHGHNSAVGWFGYWGRAQSSHFCLQIVPQFPWELHL